MRITLVAILALAISDAVLAQSAPIVRATVTPETVAVGEPAELSVTVLVPTWFTRPPVYPSLELTNAITRLPADSSYSIRERVGNDSWSGIVRSYKIYPLLGATYRLTGQSLSIAYANPGNDPVIVDVDVPEIVFRGAVPAGAEALDPYIAGRSLSLRLEVEGTADNLAAGDALVVNYVAELDGLPAIFLPPLAPDLQLEGVSVYADQPDVEDGVTARRSEKLTLVFNAGGEFTLPGTQIGFWNTTSQSIEVATAPDLQLSVVGPLAAVDEDVAETDSRRQRWAALGAGFIALLFLLQRWGPEVTRRYREAIERRRQSEGYAFRKLLESLRVQDAAISYHALLLWVERLEPGMSSRQLASNHGDESLLSLLDTLSQSIYAGSESALNYRQLAAGLGQARRRYFRQSGAATRSVLPPLNP
jgi:hypothetical protein